MAIVISVWLSTSIVLISIIIVLIVRRLYLDSNLNYQIIVSNGTRIGETASPSVELYDVELLHHNTLIEDDMSLQRIFFQDVVTNQVQIVEFYNQVIIGRAYNGSDGVFIVNKEGVSRTHSRIFMDNGYYYIEDLNSLNHTYLNGVQVIGHRVLNYGYRVTFGASDYIFLH